MQQVVNKETLNDLNTALQNISLRVETIEETKNNEALVLSIALIIKENALYNRSFAKDVDILTDLATDQPSIQGYISTLNSLKNEAIENDIYLVNKFNSLVDNIVFEEDVKNIEVSSDENAVTKSIKMIKDTVAGINFDKVVILKKDKKTNEQKALVSKLKELVNAYNFSEALSLIRNNPQFNKVKNNDFIEWQNSVQKNIIFNEAISRIITSELSAIRTNFEKIKNVTTEE